MPYIAFYSQLPLVVFFVISRLFVGHDSSGIYIKRDKCMSKIYMQFFFPKQIPLKCISAEFLKFSGGTVNLYLGPFCD